MPGSVQSLRGTIRVLWIDSDPERSYPEVRDIDPDDIIGRIDPSDDLVLMSLGLVRVRRRNYLGEVVEPPYENFNFRAMSLTTPGEGWDLKGEYAVIGIDPDTGKATSVPPLAIALLTGAIKRVSNALKGKHS